MARIKIALPDQFSFTCKIPIRISDINYGNHVGNDAILSIIHEARMQFFNHLGATELEFFGTGLIMADAAIEFKSELFYGDVLIIAVTITEITKIGFDIIYKLEKESPAGNILAATAKTGMICFDYTAKKLMPVPQNIQQ
jgi:acyl-CoA thioester hydrolase